MKDFPAKELLLALEEEKEGRTAPPNISLSFHIKSGQYQHSGCILYFPMCLLTLNWKFQCPSRAVFFLIWIALYYWHLNYLSDMYFTLPHLQYPSRCWEQSKNWFATSNQIQEVNLLILVGAFQFRLF